MRRLWVVVRWAPMFALAVVSLVGWLFLPDMWNFLKEDLR